MLRGRIGCKRSDRYRGASGQGGRAGAGLGLMTFYLLDTNVLIGAIKGDESIRERLAAIAVNEREFRRVAGLRVESWLRPAR